jgi:small-conductance mechanosensitive channel
MQRIPAILEAAVRAHDKTRFERSHFSAYGESALQFETVYFVLDSDYLLYANTQQAINLRILEEFERLGIKFAYRTRVMLTPPGTAPEAEDGDESQSRS